MQRLIIQSYPKRLNNVQNSLQNSKLLIRAKFLLFPAKLHINMQIILINSDCQDKPEKSKHFLTIHVS